MQLWDDTSLEAERVQIELLQKAGPSGRFRLMRSLSRSMLTLSYHAVRNNMPDADQDTVDARFVEVNYGRKLAEQLREFLRRKANA